MSLTIGIDIGGTRIKAAAMDSSGNLYEKRIERSSAGQDYRTLLRQLDALIGDIRSNLDSKVTSVGLAVAGLMDKQREVIIEAPNCPDMKNRYLTSDLSQRVKLPIVMDNDANLMAIGEGAFGSAQGCAHFIAITLGTGVGGAVISDSHLIRGVDGGGGELGHIPIDIDGPECGCGAHGCLESYIGQIGIRRYIAINSPKYKETGLQELNELAIEGDAEAMKVFEYIGTMLAVGLGGLVNTFNPELILVGGGVAAAGTLLFEPLRRELKNRAFAQYINSLTIKEAHLGNWAGVVGSAKIAETK